MIYESHVRIGEVKIYLIKLQKRVKLLYAVALFFYKKMTRDLNSRLCLNY